MDTQFKVREIQECFHCGDMVNTDNYSTDGHSFCCLGCQSVYLLLHQNNLTSYYRYNQHPGKQLLNEKNNFLYLEEEAIARQLIDFKDTHIAIVSLYIPAIHCSSCIWLLENLFKLDSRIVSSRADFLKKQVKITYDHQHISLKGIVELLDRIGYAPHISLDDMADKPQKEEENRLIRKIAVAGFCFGNAMMISFPEYFGIADFEKNYATLFGWINLSFALTSMLYSGRDYFISSIKSLKQFHLNLDVPLALGIAILFIRSAIEILQGTGAGFSDTLCGLVFFLLIGKWVQRKTYYHLSFERDYRSYFPVAVTKLIDGKEKAIPLADLRIGDRILIRNNEIIPADAILLDGNACIDFSFVTGESIPVKKVLGEIVYAGGKQTDQAITLEVVKSVSQSYLTSLWNDQQLNERHESFHSFSNTVSKYFTPVLLSIAMLSALFWWGEAELSKAWEAFTAVLIIACPCALALSSPFTLSAVLSIFDRNGFYMKNTLSVEKMAQIDTLIFDKTGTITTSYEARRCFSGDLTMEEQALVFSACRNSSHPSSRAIIRSLAHVQKMLPLTYYEEVLGKGIRAKAGDKEILIGSVKFLEIDSDSRVTGTYVKIDGEIKGVYSIEQQWRHELNDVLANLKQQYQLHLISGDTDKDKHALSLLFPNRKLLHFNQLPSDKLRYIKQIQNAGNRVAMLGDGLNDGAALRQAHLGIAVSDDINNFSPACDAILKGQSFTKLPQFFKLSKQAMKVIYSSFVISISYNLVGLYFAVQGNMSPLFAAILMPLSTVTIVCFTSVATRLYALKNKLL